MINIIRLLIGDTLLRNLMKILISGGAGYLGSYMIDYMLSYLWGTPLEITVLDNLMYKQDGLVPLCGKYGDRLSFVYGDVRDTPLLEKWAEWADVIIPLAALVGMPICERDKKGAYDINYKHVNDLACHCYNKPQKKLIFPQTNSGYGLGQGELQCTEETPLTPISTYGITKCSAEASVLSVGGVAFRLATVFGVSPRMRLDLLVNDFTYKAVTDGYIVLFEKDFKRNYVHVKDVARAFCFAIEDYDRMRGQAYNLGLSSANLSKYELALKIKEQVPNFSIQVDDIRQDPDKRNYVVSNAKIERLGFSPEVSLEQGIKELINAYKIIAPVSKRYGNA
jgi:nucleoside-diphosphate-sugar epimerase